MAKKRYISDSIWTDNWFEGLSPEKKLLFIYLISNKLVSICGFYEITIRQIAFDTGINQKDVEKYLIDFENDKKVFFNKGIICIVNFVKNQNITSTNDNLYKGIEREIKEFGNEKLAYILEYKGAYKVLEGAYKVLDIPYLTLLNFTGLNLSGDDQEKKEINKKNPSYEIEKPQVMKNDNLKERERERERENKYKENKEIYREFKHLSLTVEEFNKLNETYTKEAIDDILDNIENYKKNKDYVNLYLTAKNWLKKRSGKKTVIKYDFASMDKNALVDLRVETKGEIQPELRKFNYRLNAEVEHIVKARQYFCGF